MQPDGRPYRRSRSILQIFYNRQRKQARGKPVPFDVMLQPGRSNGLAEASFVKCEQVLTVARERLVRKLGVVGKDELQKVGQAVRLVLTVF